MVNAMSDLSVKTALDGAVSQPRRSAPIENKNASGQGVAHVVGQGSAKGASPDVSNYVTSPKGIVDPESGVYVLQYRDGATGEVLNQYPSEKAVSAYKRGASNGEVASPPPVATTDAQSASVATPGGTTPTQAVGGSVEGGAAVSTASTGSVGTTSTVGQGSVSTTPTSVDV